MLRTGHSNMIDNEVTVIEPQRAVVCSEKRPSIERVRKLFKGQAAFSF